MRGSAPPSCLPSTAWSRNRTPQSTKRISCAPTCRHTACPEGCGGNNGLAAASLGAATACNKCKACWRQPPTCFHHLQHKGNSLYPAPAWVGPQPHRLPHSLASPSGAQARPHRARHRPGSQAAANSQGVSQKTTPYAVQQASIQMHDCRPPSVLKWSLTRSTTTLSGREAKRPHPVPCKQPSRRMTAGCRLRSRFTAACRQRHQRGGESRDKEMTPKRAAAP